MKNNAKTALLALMMFASVVSVGAKSVTDMAGRQVDVPDKINKVYVNHQPGVILMHTLDLDLLAGWAFNLLPGEKLYVPEKYHSLPVFGTVGGNNSGNREVIMAAKPDIALIFTTIDKMTKDLTSDFQKATGIPTILADMTIKNVPEVYRFVGKLLEREEKAEKLAKYCERVLAKSKQINEALKASDKIKVYYAQGPKGLNSSPSGSSHAEVIDMAGGFNVVERDSLSDARIAVNMEQVMLWNPEVILLADRIHSVAPEEKDPVKLLVSLNEGWKNIKAVRDGRVYFVPCVPYNILDMPPSVNRIIGVLWLGNLLYPGKFTENIEKDFIEFYELFYEHKLSEEELKKILFK